MPCYSCGRANICPALPGKRSFVISRGPGLFSGTVTRPGRRSFPPSVAKSARHTEIHQAPCAYPSAACSRRSPANSAHNRRPRRHSLTKWRAVDQRLAHNADGSSCERALDRLGDKNERRPLRTRFIIAQKGAGWKTDTLTAHEEKTWTRRFPPRRASLS